MLRGASAPNLIREDQDPGPELVVGSIWGVGLWITALSLSGHSDRYRDARHTSTQEGCLALVVSAETPSVNVTRMVYLTN